MIQFLLLLFNNKQEQFSSLIAIQADVSQVAVSPSEDTESNLWLVRQDNHYCLPKSILQLLKLKLACLLFLQKLFFAHARVIYFS